MKLYCMRHGEAVSGMENHGRPLSKHGEFEVAQIAKFAASLSLNIPACLHSSALRASMTAEIMSSQLGIESVQQCDSILSETADVAPIVEMLENTQQDTLLVGHQPSLTDLISALLLQKKGSEPLIHLSTASLVCLARETFNTWVIEWVLTPDLLSVE